MKKKRFGSFWTYGFSLVLLIGISILFTSYYLYIDKQRELFSRNLIRQLGISSNNILETLNGICTNVHNANKAVNIDEAIKKLELIPYLDVLKGEEDKNNDSKTDSVSYEIARSDREVMLKIRVYKTKSQSDKQDPVDIPVATASAKLSDLLYPSLPKDIFEYFDGGVLIVRNDTGEVLVETGASLQLIKLPEELPSSGPFRDETAPQKKKESYNIDRVQVLDVEINNKRYKMFLRPFRLPEKIGLEKSGKGEKVLCQLLLAGLVPRATFLAKTLTISPTLALVILCSLGIGLLGLPYLHLRCIGYREGLRYRDVLVAFVALMIGCSLATMAIVHVVTYMTERDVQRIRLERIAESIQSRFQQEMQQMENILTNWAVKQVPEGEEEKVISEKGNGHIAYVKKNVLKDVEFEYPLFEMLISMDGDGRQQRKWSIKNETTSILKVNDREYFYRAKNLQFNYFPKIDSKLPLNESRFVDGRFVQSIRSKTTGDAYTMLSLRHLDKKGEDQGAAPNAESRKDAVVSVIETKSLSLIDPVLPPGYEFAVIDSSGMVQFHSQANRNLRENFYEELSSNLEVRAIADAGVSRHTRIDYRFFPYNAYVSRFSHTPWTLIVFVKQQVLGHMNLETFTFTLALYGVYLFLFIMAFMVVYYTGCRNTEAGEVRRQWFWPDREKLINYRYLIYIAVGFIAIWVLGDLLNQTIMVLWCILYPLILIGIMCCLLRRKVDQSTPSRFLLGFGGMKRTYLIMVSTFITTIAVLPPVTFYSAIHKEEAEVFTKYHQYGLAQRLQSRFVRHVERYKDVEFSPENNNRNWLMDILYPKSSSGDTGRCVHEAGDIHTFTGCGDQTCLENIRESITGFERESTDESQQFLIQYLRKWSPLPEYDRMSSLARQLAGPQNEVGAGLGKEQASNEQQGNERRNMDFHRAPEAMILFMNDYRPDSTPGKATSFGNNFGLVDLRIETPLEYHPRTSLLWFLLLGRHGYPFLLLLCAALGIFILVRMVKTLLRLVFLTDLNYPLSLNWKPLITVSDEPKNKNDRKTLSPEAPFKKQLHIRLRVKEKALIRPADRKTNPSSNPVVIGMQEIRFAASMGSLVLGVRNSHGNTVILEQFDRGLNETDIAIKKLELLEDLTAMKEKMIVVKTAIDPLFFMTSRAHDFMREENEKEIPVARWAAVLEGFMKLRSESAENDYTRLRDEFTQKLNPEKLKVLDEDVQKALIDEGWPNSRLNEYVTQLVELNVPRTFTASDIVDQVRDLADANYRRIWMTCSTDEKVLLFRLAHEGFVNWRMKDSLRSLMRRRLVVSGPNYRLMNESFRKFVLNAEQLSVFQEWQDAAGESLWARIRIPIILVGTIVAAFFFFTQKEVFSQSIKILAALTAGIPALIKLVGSVLPVKSSVSPQD